MLDFLRCIWYTKMDFLRCMWYTKTYSRREWIALILGRTTLGLFWPNVQPPLYSLTAAEDFILTLEDFSINPGKPLTSSASELSTLTTIESSETNIETTSSAPINDANILNRLESDFSGFLFYIKVKNKEQGLRIRQWLHYM